MISAQKTLVMVEMLLALTWNVRLKGGPMTPGSSNDSSDLMSYRDGFESLLKYKHVRREKNFLLFALKHHLC